MSETIRISELANLIVADIGNFLKWKIHEENDLDFTCCIKEEHFKGSKPTDKKTHPTDLVISYIDPYENKKIYFNTDLKSYASKSIGYSAVKDWLISLTNGTVCSNVSKEWKQRYSVEGEYEIRGLLFVYNHDGLFETPFYSFIYDYPNHPPSTKKKSPSRFHLKDLDIPTNIKLHIIDPLLIDSILSIKLDLDILKTKGKVPSDEVHSPISFYYPNRQRKKPSLTPKECPATLELISGPFFIMTYESFITYSHNPKNLKKPKTIENNRGNIIYYKDKGDSVDEFIYLIESLMMYELIHENCDTYIRHYSREKCSNAKQNFTLALSRYCEMWDYSDNMKVILNKIEYEEVTIIKQVFCNKKIDRPLKETT